MPQEKFDVIIVGCGPAGSSCAQFLARGGAKVLMIDKAKFPRDKTCGDAISGKSSSILRELDLEKEIESRPHAKIFGVTLSFPNGSIVEIPIAKRRGQQGYGYCCRRMVFDNLMFEAAKKSASVVQQFQVTELIMEENKVVGVKGTDLANNKQKEFHAKVVVGADGALSIVAKKLGVDEVDPNHYVSATRVYYKNVKGVSDKIEIHFVEDIMPGYFWIFPLENGYANVGVGMLFSQIKKRSISLKDATFDIIKNNQRFKERFKDAQIAEDIRAWTLPLGSKHRKSAFAGAVLIGDAASLIDPFSGEGVGNALTSGKIAAETILEAIAANDFSEAFLQRYEDRLRDTLDKELQTSYKLQRLGTNRFLLNTIIGKAAKKEEVRNVIAHTLTEETPLKDLVSPISLLKMLLA